MVDTVSNTLADWKGQTEFALVWGQDKFLKVMQLRVIQTFPLRHVILKYNRFGMKLQ